jgi:signal transduction histidine kinase
VSLALLVFAGLSWLAGAAALVRLRRRLELVARAEHELRGPATALELACRRMRREGAGVRYAAVVEAQLDRLRAGLAELDAARSGRRRRAWPRPRPAELSSTARAALAPWELEPGSAGFEWLGGPAVTRLDRGELSRVLGNLMANAAEHGAGEIRVNGHTTPGAVRIEIRNPNRERDGAGSRAAWPASPVSGRGRGLRIAERAARQLGGRLLVEVGERETVAVLELPRSAGGDEDVAA